MELSKTKLRQFVKKLDELTDQVNMLTSVVYSLSKTKTKSLKKKKIKYIPTKDIGL